MGHAKMILTERIPSCLTQFSSDAIRFEHPLVHRGVLDVETICTIPFTYSKRGRPRPSTSMLSPLRPSLATQKQEIKQPVLAPKKEPRDQSKRRTVSVSQRRAGTATVATMAIPTSPDAVPPSKAWKPHALSNAPPAVALLNRSNESARSRQRFPFVLARLMQELDSNHLEELIQWNPAGTAILLRQKNSISSEQSQRLQRYFTHGSPNVIKRQLEHYQFQKAQLEL